MCERWKVTMNGERIIISTGPLMDFLRHSGIRPGKTVGQVGKLWQEHPTA
jgi:hypothetical protein